MYIFYCSTGIYFGSTHPIFYGELCMHFDVFILRRVTSNLQYFI